MTRLFREIIHHVQGTLQKFGLDFTISQPLSGEKRSMGPLSLAPSVLAR